MKLLILAVSCSFSAIASAAVVNPDSLLCESPEPFATIAAEKWTSVGGTAQLKTAEMSAQATKLYAKSASINRDLATREESIRADASRRIATGSTAARGGAADSDAKAAESQASVYERIASTCAASGAEPLQAEVLERKPITGTAKVQVPFRGAPAQLWVRTSDLRD